MHDLVLPAELTAVSLFDGIGGFPLALAQNGVRTTAAVEINAQAAGVVADRYPHIVHFDDVTEVTGDQLRATGFDPARGILTGGWPCQDLSLAGRRMGLGGARSGLFYEIVRLLADLRCRWFLLENVPGLLSAVCSCPGLGVCGRGCSDPHTVRGGACGPGRCMELHGGAMGAVLGELGKLGYHVAYRVLDAQHFGVPQRRRRVVLVGRLGDGAAPASVLLEPARSGGDPPTRRQAGARPSRLAAAGTGVGGDRAEPRARESVGAVSTLAGGGRRGYRVDAETAVGRADTAGPQGKGYGDVGEPAFTLDTVGGQAIAVEGVPDLAYALTARASMDRPESKAVTLVPTVTAKWAKGTGGPAGDEAQNMVMTHAADDASGGIPFTTVTGNVTHALTSEGADASEDGTGRTSVPSARPRSELPTVTRWPPHRPSGD